MDDSPLMNLPAELRVRIFEYALKAGAPRKRCKTKTNRTSKPKVYHGASLLFVNQLIQTETLPIFYKYNTFKSSSIALLARFDSLATNPTTSLHLKLLTHLYLDSFSAPFSCPHISGDCTVCKLQALDVLRVLPQMSRLKTLKVDYGPNGESEDSFQVFKKALRGSALHAERYGLQCVGIGRYTMTDSLSPNLRISFVHGPLSHAWDKATPEMVVKAMERRRRTRSPNDPAHHDEDFHHYRIRTSVTTLYAAHDGAGGYSHSLIPLMFRGVWPRNAHVDYRKLGHDESTMSFLEDMDEAVLKWTNERFRASEQSPWIRKW